MHDGRNLTVSRLGDTTEWKASDEETNKKRESEIDNDKLEENHDEVFEEGQDSNSESGQNKIPRFFVSSDQNQPQTAPAKVIPLLTIIKFNKILKLVLFSQ